MKQVVAFLLLCVATLAAEPSIIGPKSVKVGQPPWVTLSLKDAAPGSVSRWSGAIGPGLVGMESKDGVAVSTAVPGRYAFRCVLQVPKDGLDDVVILETVIVVEGDGVVPVPDVVPVVDWQERLTAAVRAKPESHTGLAKVAGVYGLVAEKIADGLLTSPDQVTRMTTAMTGFASPEWAAIDASIVQPHLKTLTLATAAEYEPVWRQIQAAIKAGLTDIPPPPDVVPIPVTSLHVLIVEEMDDRGTLPASQVGIFTSTDLRTWFVEHNAQWRMFDEDVPTDNLSDVWKAGLKKVQDSGLQLPVVLVSNGTKGTIEKLPKSVAELTTLLEKYR